MVNLLLNLIRGTLHTLQLVSRATMSLIFVGSAGSISRNALVKVRNLLLVAVRPVFVGLDLVRGKGLVGAFPAGGEILDEALIALGTILLPLAEQIKSQSA